MLRHDESLVRDALGSIVAHLVEAGSAGDPGLLGGAAGHALFLWYLEKRYPDLVPAGLFDSIAETVQDSAAQPGMPANIAVGIGGIAAFLELVLQEQGGEYDPGYNLATDALLLRSLKQGGLGRELEYVTGMAGIAVYAARRARAGHGMDLYEGLVGHFEERACWQGDGTCAWATPEDSHYRTASPDAADAVEFNFGLAHGVPSIVAALIPAVGHARTRARAEPLVRSACDWLIAQAQHAGVHGSHFAYTSVEKKESRLGWCYGDLGVAVTLARAGHALGERRFLDAARRYATDAAARCDHSSAQIRDGAICHGSAGLSLMFLEMYRLQGAPDFLRAAQFWFDDLQDLYRSRGFQGFHSWCATEDRESREYRPVTGLLEGSVGIGLCLLAGVGVEPAWADLILLR